MMKPLALAAAASMALAVALPAEAAMPSAAIGVHTIDHATPVKLVAKKVCHPVFKWRWVWWKGHKYWVKVKVGHKCHWEYVKVKPWPGKPWQNKPWPNQPWPKQPGPKPYWKH